MRELTPPSRRRFGQGLGACLTLVGLGRPASAHDGTHVVTVRISDFAFVPARIEIVAGDTVIWINDDLAPHTATDADGDWDTGAVETGRNARRVFETAGEYEYLCAFHPHMTGSVSVRPNPTG